MRLDDQAIPYIGPGVWTEAFFGELSHGPGWRLSKKCLKVAQR